MTVAAQATAVGYTGNGVTTVFAYPFRILDATYIKVFVNGVLQGGGYTVSGVNNPTGGNVTFAVAPANGAVILFQRQTAQDQLVDYTPYDPFPSETHETALDKLTMLVQEGIAGANNAIRIPPNEATITQLPSAALRASTFVAFDVAGNVIAAAGGVTGVPVTPFMATVLDDLTAAAARTTLDAVGISNNENITGQKTFTNPTTFSGSVVATSNVDLGALAIATTPPNGDDSTRVVTTTFVNNMAGRTKRQTALFGRVDVNGVANFLTTGAGLRPGIAATAIPLELSFASGMKDYYEQFTADIADPLGADASANNTTHFYRTRGGPWGQCLVPPDYGYVFDRTRGCLLNFEAADQSTNFIDDFGNTWSRGSSNTAKIVTAQFKFGASSLLLDGAANSYITTTNVATFHDGSWEVSLWFRINALPGVGATAALFGAFNAGGFGVQLSLNNTAGTTKTQLNLSSDGSSWNIANATLGANTVWNLNQWNKVRLVFDALAGTYKVYLSLNAAAETADQSVSSSARINNVANIRIGADTAGGSNFNGWIDAFRFIRAATKTTTATPAAAAPTIADHPYHHFSLPDMKMYEVTAASVTAGVNPTLTQRNRVFLGDFDTSGAAVTAARTYGLRGEYIAANITPLIGVSTAGSYNHNLGIRPMDLQIVLTALGSDNGYVTGDEVRQPMTYTNASSFNECVHTVRADRKTASFATANSGSFALLPKGGGAPVPLTGAAWAFRIEARRGW